MNSNNILGLIRIALGWIFFWPFLDKVFGLGFATETGSGWIDGVSPTTGYLTYATQGPFANAFQSLAGSAFVDWLFMLGLLLIGLALILGIGMRVATTSGIVLLMLMWLATLPPMHNPVIDDHIIYSLMLIALYGLNAGNYIGIGKWWSNLSVVKKNPILQ